MVIWWILFFNMASWPIKKDITKSRVFYQGYKNQTVNLNKEKIKHLASICANIYLLVNLYSVRWKKLSNLQDNTLIIAAYTLIIHYRLTDWSCAFTYELSLKVTKMFI